jgi:hypothetical protein
MAEKPSDYFLGALDFFGILVPGAVSLALIIAWYPGTVQSISKVIDLGSGRAVAFAVLAYLLGYLVHSSSLALDRVSDIQLRKDHPGRRRGKNARKATWTGAITRVPAQSGVVEDATARLETSCTRIGRPGRSSSVFLVRLGLKL